VTRALPIALVALVSACGDLTPDVSRSGARSSATAARSAPAAAPVDNHERELATLRTFEQQRRAATDFATLPPSDVALGPDPYRVATLAGGLRIGLLRGESAVVVLDALGREQERLAAPRSPSGLAVSRDGDVLVVGEAARELAHYRVRDGHLARVATMRVDALGMRDVALADDGRTAYIVEDREGRLLAVALSRAVGAPALRATGMRELGRCHGPIRVAALAGTVAVNCLLDHAIELRRGDEVARIQHDGPLWSFALDRTPDGGLLVAAGGVEDHPLVREDGGFGYIDSYVYLYRLALGAPQPTRLAAINSSALDVVTPKWIALRQVGADLAITTAGYASAHLVTLTWRDGDFAAAPRLASVDLPPGTSDAQLADDGALIAANPLLDAWVVRRGAAPQVIAVASARGPRPWPSRLGELLFFTTLMSPWNSADGKLSRFTCETCHHEGYVDGRVHFTGRGDVHTATRPLLGLFNNAPHFSRALDRTTTDMVHAEFRVANRHNGRDPWFALTRADAPWLALVPDAPAELSPVQLREAFLTFLGDFTHRANPAAIDHARFTALERRGARAFLERCASCHAARLIAEAPASAVPFERWEPLVLSPSGPIVWSDAAYAQTGVTPYVHPSGARVPPLRRLAKKWPYFSNGSAHGLDELLAGYAFSLTATYHAAAPADPTLVRLTSDERAALLAFLALL